MGKTIAFILLPLILITTSCVKKVEEEPPRKAGFGLVVHGGAGYINPGTFSPQKKKLYINKLKEAIAKGSGVLANGGTALDAVETVINILEDSPLFNAGKGAVFTAEGTNELDASIMDGKTLNAGAVAGVKHIKNPISLARLVMEKSPHVMLSGEGAEAFAKEQGIELVDNKYFFTEERWNYYQKVKKEKMKNETAGINLNSGQKFGTVGCVALDKNGNLAAGTSTGGMTFKRFGRIGDSPVIGAGTYANNNTCAISCTGHGEFFIRNVVAYDISALMEYKGLSLNKAAGKVVLDKLVKAGGDGGIIGIDKYGNIAMPFNTKSMFRGFSLNGQEPVIKIFKGG